MKILLTGASGFVGSHVLRHLLINTDWQIVAPYTFRHKGLPARISSSVCDQPEWADRVDLVHWDLRTPADSFTLSWLEDCEAFLNIASESHVDRSITAPDSFVRSNVDIILNVLAAARIVRPRLLLHMSTDEVYGPAYGAHRHLEWETVLPSNPYSASKAAQEAIAISYWRTYDVPLMITNTMNIIGEMQDPEKFLPLVIRNLHHGRPVPVHIGEDGTPGSRFYLHARNLADAWMFLTECYVENGPALYSEGATMPDRFHIVGEREVDNMSLVHQIGRIMGLEPDEIKQLIRPMGFHSSRPGHDLRYALNGDKLLTLGWCPPVGLDDALERTVKWTLEHPEWLDL